MAMWTFRDNETIEWDGTISAKNNLVVGGNVNSKGSNYNYFMGNVGIGTTTPPGRLGILSSSTGTYPLWIQSSDMQNLFLVGEDALTNGFLLMYNEANNAPIKLNTAGDSYLSGGNVGIGTASPGAKLEIYNADADIILSRLTSTYGTTNNYLAFDSPTIGGQTNDLAYLKWTRDNSQGRKFSVVVSNNIGVSNEAFTVYYDSKVGIGTIDPEQLLQVAGSGAITEYGGYAVKMIADEVVSGGYVVRASIVGSNKVRPCGLADGYAGGNDMPIGVVYHTTPLTSANNPVWVVVSGRAKVYCLNDPQASYGYFLRTSDTTSGATMASTNPTVPADASHWREIGHSLGQVKYSSNTSGALLDCILHFN